MDWNDLPEQYRNPEQVKALLDRVPTIETEAQRYKDFYEKEYAPWLQEHGTAFQAYQREADEYQRWKATGIKGAAGDHGGESGGREASPAIDFDHDPDALPKTYQALHDDIASVRSELGGLKTAYEAERNNVYQLFALQEQAYGLQNTELYDHLGFKPKTNVREVAQYARDHGLADLTEAAQQLYRGDREKQIAQEAYARAMHDAELKYRNERVTTEMGSGTPLPELRRQRPEGLQSGYGNANLEAMQRAITERRAARRMATS